MITAIIERISLPDNPAVYAVIETILLFLAVLILGFLIELINRMITNALAGIIGSVPAFILRNYLTYPGTVHHELSHALLALITGAAVKKIVLFPKGNTLGSVEIEPRGNLFFRALQLSLSAIAPVIMGVISLFSLWTFVLPKIGELWQYILFWYIFVSIILHMSLSGADYKNFFKGLLPSILVFFLVFLLLGSFGIRFG